MRKQRVYDVKDSFPIHLGYVMETLRVPSFFKKEFIRIFKPPYRNGESYRYAKFPCEFDIEFIVSSGEAGLEIVHISALKRSHQILFNGTNSACNRRLRDYLMNHWDIPRSKELQFFKDSNRNSDKTP